MGYTIKKLPISYKGENFSLSYTSWGETNTEKVICVHGLTRNCRDFDYIARELSSYYHVICIDLPGRGKSDWLNDYHLYQYQTYIDCIYELIDSCQLQYVNWIGSSLGGILGMKISTERPLLIRKLILNDIGPFVPFKALSKIGGYVNKYPRFQNLQEGEEYLRKIIPNFGIKLKEDWQYITENSFFQGEDGLYQQAYDPNLVKAFIETHYDDIEMWEVWNQINSEILVIRGQNSNILLRDTAELMKSSKNILLHELEDVGHTPSLMNRNEILLIKEWLLNK
jgi:pimeloyl-ACP methyl ester carboxylesterase